MLSARCRGGALAVEGKIYIFCGNYDLGRGRRAWGPWGEVFDPIRNEWEPLPPPPFNYDDYEEEYVRSGLPIAAYGNPSDTKIMFSGKATHCAYHVKSGTDGMPVWIKDDEVEEEVAGEVSRMPKLRNNMSTNIKFEEVDNEVETSI
ncbi:hypothetical protein RHGRI_003814 [Rhododendron griersonianum]|uniref:Galactose oxidase/kelch repeat superfamily protein n=1 Tax=Rhododendron griersonianum TaxID=479676 RepID=A0AAV6L7D8_9ERIC|nr:hypothetical protein RHGRI_003814 [Rhododendron griersonianum]